MSDMNQTNYPNWTDDQWGRLRKIVSDEAQKARVAAQFLPLYGPVDASVVAVPNLRLSVASPPPAPGVLRPQMRLAVDSSPDIFLATISVLVPLATHEVAEDELLAAAVSFRRAAVTVARIEDALIFNGQPGRGLPPIPTFPPGWLASMPPIYSVTGGSQWAGLVPAGALPRRSPRPGSVFPRQAVPLRGPVPPVGAPLSAMQKWGDVLVSSINAAIGDLEGNGHSGPFACYLSPDAFEAVHTPTSSLVLPRDRILPFLGGDYLRRSNTVPAGYGVIIALGGSPVEIVVASDISIQYLQRTPDPRFLFRVSERIALRVKEWNAVAILYPASAKEYRQELTNDRSVPSRTNSKPKPPKISDIDRAAFENNDDTKTLRADIENAYSELADLQEKKSPPEKTEAALQKCRSLEGKLETSEKAIGQDIGTKALSDAALDIPGDPSD
jgi:uncharacterized linocin/CFP29 family protein